MDSLRDGAASVEDDAIAMIEGLRLAACNQRTAAAPERHRDHDDSEAQRRRVETEVRASLEGAKQGLFSKLKRRATCGLGFHKGEWFYDDSDACRQTQLCHRCGEQSQRVEHEWFERSRVLPDRCEFVAFCSRCDGEQRTTDHSLFWRYLSTDCREIQECEHCGEADVDSVRVRHSWSAWEPGARDEHRRRCQRCGETETRHVAGATTPSTPATVDASTAPATASVPTATSSGPRPVERGPQRITPVVGQRTVGTGQELKIFVSYRRDDSRDTTIGLCERLGDAFGPSSVFRDEDSIAPGAGFVGGIGGGIYTANVILVVVGPRWLTVADSRGRRRLDDKEDVVRMEIGLALASRRPTIPVLVDGASMPSRGDLPRDIRNFASLSAVSLSSGAGSNDSIASLIAALGGPRSDAAAPSGATRRPRRNVSWSSFEGRWQGHEGAFSEFVQDGAAIELNGRAPNGVEILGRGSITGHSATLECVNTRGVQGRLRLELTQDGGYLNGTWTDSSGVFPVHMMRRG